MNILFVSCHTIWKTIGGRENSLNNRITTIVDSGYNVDVLYFNNSDDYGVCKVNINEYYCKKKISFIEKTFNLFKCFFMRNIPFQSALYIGRNQKKELKRLLKQKTYDFIFVDMARLAPLVTRIRKYSGAKLIIDLDDLISRRYNSNKGIMGQAEKDNRFINKIVNSFIGDFLVRMERKRLVRLERKIPSLFDCVTLISIKETKELAKITQKNNIYYFPMMISDNAFATPIILKKKKSIVIGFAGLLATPANNLSLVYILNDILPRLNFDFTFKVIGKVNESFRKKYESDKIVFTGFVDDFKSELRTLDLFLCPMVFGTGIKTKILEAMAAGIPVLTNSIGAEGLFVNSGHEIIIEDEIDRIINCLNDIYNEPEKLNIISISGNDYVKKYHSKNVFLNSFNNIISSNSNRK